MAMTVWRIPRESKEWIGPLVININGVPTTDYELSLVAVGDRPITWVAPTLIGANRGLMVGPTTSFPVTPGPYRIWARVLGVTPEAPVIDDVGSVDVT